MRTSGLGQIGSHILLVGRHLKQFRQIPSVKMATETSNTTEPGRGVALLLTGFGGYDKLKVTTIDKPHKPERNELLVNIRASGINFAELMARQGLYDRTPKLPAALGMEATGDVLMVGEDVTKFKVGDRVICMKDFGLWAEFVCVPAVNCFKMPDAMSYEQGAAIPVNYITAYHMLFEFGNLRPGNSVLIHMAAGGVGTAATQLCKTVANVTVFGTASASKHEAIRQLGVDHPIDYRTQDYVTEIRKISPQGVDIVLDPLSGADSTKGFDLLKPFGKIIHFGAANVVSGEHRSYWNMVKTYLRTKNYSPLGMINTNKAVAGYHLGHLIDHPDLIQSAGLALIELFEQGKIRPQIDSVWSFDDVSKAMSRMHQRQNVGKVIICPHKPTTRLAASTAAATAASAGSDAGDKL